MNKPLGILLGTATALIALATTTAPAEADDVYSGWGRCPNTWFNWCTNGLHGSTSYANDIRFTCGASWYGYGYTEGYWGPNFSSAGSEWNYDVSSFCADYTGPNSGSTTATYTFAFCQYGVAALYGGLHIHC
jgi:hypothetical protein